MSCCSTCLTKKLWCLHLPLLSFIPQAVDLARRLMLEFNAWVVRAHALRKVFVSVKGIYFQVGCPILSWHCHQV